MIKFKMNTLSSDSLKINALTHQYNIMIKSGTYFDSHRVRLFGTCEPEFENGALRVGFLSLLDISKLLF